jgi:AAA+ superfamily predicted ATPase
LSGGTGFKNVILHPSLKQRIQHLARATANTKSHDAPFRNMMFYGPPGTGKTLVAREMARKSVSYQINLFLEHSLGMVCSSYKNNFVSL